MFLTGLNPYGLTFTLGLQGHGTPRANPHGTGLAGFLTIAEQSGARSIELHAPWLLDQPDSVLHSCRDRLAASNLQPVISLGPPLERVGEAIHIAHVLGASVLRLGLTPVLCGARAALGERWHELVAHARRTLLEQAPRAADLGISLAIEDHQDFGSEELLAFCEEAGPSVGICLDTGNPLAVAEDPIAFTERVAPKVRHVHLKDYRAQWTDEGYRLIRCAIGDGAIPLAGIAAVLSRHHQQLTASIEPAALEARHIRLFADDWWTWYPARTARELGPCLAAARRCRLPEDADCRTPWESQAPAEELLAYERTMLQRSIDNLIALGWWKE